MPPPDRPFRRPAPAVSILLALWCAHLVGAAAPPPTERPWTRWWWPGSAVDRAGITAQLESFATAGLGGVEITPIYGARGAEDRARPFLAPDWNEALAHTLSEADRLGLGVDMATGTGWPFGGPWVDTRDTSHRLIRQDGRLAGSPTGMQVKRAAPGGVGPVIDPYSPAALTRYLQPIGDALDSLPAAAGLRAQFHDSFEYYGAEWTPGLARAFAAEHGYDLQDMGGILTGDTNADADTVARVKADYRTTLGRLHLEYLRTWRDWSHARGWQVRNQSHGAPANLLDLYGAVDIPETETFGSTPFPLPGLRREAWTVRGNDDLPEPLMMRMASSAAHVMGRPLVSSETCTWLREHWQVAPAMVKPEIDRLFANGINHVLYHGTVYSPPDAIWPGWLFYASTQFNPANPWWADFAALNAYVTRVQTVLQSGQPDNDVLVYWPYQDVLHEAGDDLLKPLTVHHVDWLTESPFGRTTRTLLDRGAACDYVSDDQLPLLTVTGDGELQAPGGSYRTLVVPPVRHLPLSTLENLLELVRRGAAVHFVAWPAGVPGYGDLAARRERFAALRAELETAVNRSAFALCSPDLDSVLLRAAAEPMVPAFGLEFTRRRLDDGRAYFITNLTAHPFNDWLPLATPAAAVIAEDPLDGSRHRLARRTADDESPNAVRLHLAPGQSVLLRTHRIEPPPENADLPPWPVPDSNDQPITLPGPWRLEFVRGGPVLPAGSSDAGLGDWTLRGGGAEHFAGTARYRTSFDLTPAQIAQGDAWRLDLGDVRETARVILNGLDVGTAWSLPFGVRVSDALRAGRNVLEIEVSNLAANRIRNLDRRGIPWRIMHEINFVNIRYRPFDAADWPLAPSGLLGPVALVPLHVEP